MLKDLKKYYYLTKPGIIRGNLFTGAAGFFLASKGSIDFSLLFSFLVSLAFIIGSACVFNNYIDRDIDAKMERTKKRALVRQTIDNRTALIFATLLGIGGFGILYSQTNVVALVIGLIGFIDYVIAYGFFKRFGPSGTIVGSIAGATPPAAGYTAVTGNFDAAALLLFLILVFWQMPHFFSIAIYRINDYKKARIPVLPAQKGLFTTKVQMLLYILAFFLASLFLFIYGYTGITYLTVLAILSLWWLIMCVKGFDAVNNEKWAKGMFGLSLLVVSTMSVVIGLSNWLP